MVRVTNLHKIAARALVCSLETKYLTELEIRMGIAGQQKAEKQDKTVQYTTI